MSSEKLRGRKRITEYLSTAVEALADGDYRVEFVRHGWTADRSTYYTEAALKAAAEAGTYDGVKMYLNHEGQDDRERGHRSVTEWAGTIKPGSVVMATDGLEAVAHVHDPRLQNILGDPIAKASIGLSQDAYVAYRRKVIDGQEADVVENIVQCNSVDWVPAGNAGGRVLENAGAEEATEMSIDELTLEELREARPDLVTALLATAETIEEEVPGMSEQKAAMQELMESNAALQAAFDLLQAKYEQEQEGRSQEAAAQAAVTAAGLQAHEAARVLETLRGRVIPEAEREAEIAAAIEAERTHTAAVLQAAGVQTRVENAGAAAAGAQTNTDYEARYREECAKRGVAYIPLKKDGE